MTRAVAIAAAVALTIGCSSQSNDAARGAEPAAATPVAESPSVAGKAPRGAVVTLEPSPPREMPPPEGPAIMDQYGKQFVPDMLIVRVGQPVEFRNSEDSPHNVNVNRMPTGTAVFNTATAPYQKYTHTFDQAGQYAVACDIHPGMLATVVATTTPHVVVVDDRGTFSFTDLAPGAYTLGWTVNGKAGQKPVSVGQGKTEVMVPGP